MSSSSTGWDVSLDIVLCTGTKCIASGMVVPFTFQLIPTWFPTVAAIHFILDLIDSRTWTDESNLISEIDSKILSYILGECYSSDAFRLKSTSILAWRRDAWISIVLWFISEIVCGEIECRSPMIAEYWSSGRVLTSAVELLRIVIIRYINSIDPQFNMRMVSSCCSR